MLSQAAVELLLLVLAWAAALAVQPWRLLQPHGGQVPPLVTPFLGCLVLLPALWSVPGLASVPLALHWSGAPLAVLLVGWPLAIPCLTVAGLSTMVTSGASFGQALALTVWAGILPATVVLALGHAVRKTFGTHPVGYMLGRAFFVPMAALAACGWMHAALGHDLVGARGELERVALALLALGEASWSCALVSLLVAYRPQWLATWSEALYLGRPAPARVRTARRRQEQR